MVNKESRWGDHELTTKLPHTWSTPSQLPSPELPRTVLCSPVSTSMASTEALPPQFTTYAVWSTTVTPLGVVPVSSTSVLTCMSEGSVTSTFRMRPVPKSLTTRKSPSSLL